MKTKDPYANAKETQRFAIFNVLVGNCGKQLTPDNVEKIMSDIVHEMREGPCSWAFEPRNEKP